MNKFDFISRVNAAYDGFLRVLGTLSEAQMLQPDTCGAWSVKDVIAHITWYEAEMVNVLDKKALVGSELWEQSLEIRNETIWQESSQRSLPDILEDASRVHDELMKLLSEMEEADLIDPGRFRAMPAEWIPWEMISSNTFDHYPDHTRDIERAFSTRE